MSVTRARAQRAPGPGRVPPPRATRRARAATGAPGQRAPASPPRGTAPAAGRPPGPIVWAAAVLLALAAELPLVRVFGLAGLRLAALAVPAGTAAGTAAIGMGKLRGRRSPLALAAGFAAGVAAGAVPGMALAPADPFGPAAILPRLTAAATDGWQRLLSVPVPVPASRTFTDPLVLVGAVAAALVVVAALGGRPGMALWPAVIEFGGLLALGVHGPGSAVALTAGFAAAAVIFLLALARPARRRLRPAAAATASLLVIAVAAGTATAAYGAPYDPRATFHTRVRMDVSQDPLALLPARLQSPRVPVLTATLSGALVSHPPRWVLLAYGAYDGAGWVTGATARLAVMAGGPPGAGTGAVTVTVDTPADLLPHPEYVLSSAPHVLGYAPSAEMLISPRTIRRYSVQVSVPRTSLAAVRDAGAQAGEPAGLTAVPACVPPALRLLAGQAAQAGGAAGAQALRLQQIFASQPFRLSPAGPPGESCANIGQLLATHRGTGAQFATAYVLAARLLGLPSRLAVGYLPGRMSGRAVTVTQADADAWPQVLLSGQGWVSFDPVPHGTSGAPPPSHPTTQPQPAPVPSNAPSGPPPRITGPAAAGASPLTSLTWALIAVAAVIALAGAWIGAGLLRNRRRRRCRRSAPEPASRVLGAWDELLIPLGQAGAPIHGCSAPRIARAAADLAPAQARPVRDLAALAERALYGQLSAGDADQAWLLSDQARPAVAAAAGRRTRLRRLLLPPRHGR